MTHLIPTWFMNSIIVNVIPHLGACMCECDTYQKGVKYMTPSPSVVVSNLSDIYIYNIYIYI